MDTKQVSVAIFALFCLLQMAQGEVQCGGGAPRKDLLYGCDKHWDTANHICCHNHRGAEYWGFLSSPDIALFDKLDPTKQHIFFDSVCGKPLFIAPVGRSFDDWKDESTSHGWPSFRPEEGIADNVNIHYGGRMSSTCGTHLGHNLPDFSGPRYCIDLVCISGVPVNDTFAINGTSFDASDFRSLATVPGQQRFPTWFYVALAAMAIGLIVGVLVIVRRKIQSRRRATAPQPLEEEEEGGQ
eukprot:CAMPEP_0175854706 /NCGR_PEP_ID=MMETSP0107_2-20121207/27511_1 /TAXON_ID=195067 ORGANISM="Goniomonas pacifica, Strain CCMP1869" /NCGR_SAMPLE_ID=MMETSP0107_2 /ASSEMBLY_ACC=CAM_ASM_000203 /LENGTH=240 /DNA_ID=CAMNT_0017170569 /DNA_START=46 /DNA_END=768 /DNA_ORIENTATION=-